MNSGSVRKHGEKAWAGEASEKDRASQFGG